MIKIGDNKVLVKGDLYTNMYLDPRLLSQPGISIHVKGDVHFGVLIAPNKLKSGDYYMDYETFIREAGKIYDIIGFSSI